MPTNITDIEDLQENIDDLKKNIDDAFLVINGIFVCVMQAGFACMEAGAVRTKNTANIVLQNTLDLFFSILAYWLFGFALAFGEGNSVFGYTYWAGAGLGEDLMAIWFFQFVFAATAATIVSGAVAERSTFITYITYSIIISGIVYPIASRWVWDERGWLKLFGYQDFSGCGPVHMLAGVMSFVAAAFTGPRIGRFPNKQNAPVEEIVGHSIPMVGIGGLLIVAGFLAYNSGSYVTITNPGDAGIVAKIVLNSLLGGSGAAIFTLICSRVGLFGPPAWSFTMTFNATLGGLVCTCAAANIYEMWGSFVAGLTCAPLVIILHFAMLRLRIDDPLDSVAVHFGGGISGLIARCLFSPAGITYGITKKSLLGLGYTLFGAMVLFLWSLISACIIFGPLKYFKILRVTAEEELQGLDISLHNEEGYPTTAWKNSNISCMQTSQEKFTKPSLFAPQGMQSNGFFRVFQVPNKSTMPAANSISRELNHSAREEHEVISNISTVGV